MQLLEARKILSDKKVLPSLDKLFPFHFHNMNTFYLLLIYTYLNIGWPSHLILLGDNSIPQHVRVKIWSRSQRTA